MDRYWPERRRSLPAPPCHGGVVPQKPSFSSSLLDAIYRSIDGEGHGEPYIIPASRKHTTTAATAAETKREKVALRRSVQVFNSATSGTSSDTEPVLRPIRTGGLQAQQEGRNKEKPPASPGGRLASFLMSSLWKAKATEGCRTARAPVSARGLKKRSTVRFVSDIVEEGIPAAPERRRQVKDRGEELQLWRFEEEEEEESDSSSDLFELENLKPCIGGGGGRRAYKDELPVYQGTIIRL